ncbi:secretion protein HylD [Aliidongia dinghuensis]|uniref:Secretion protein HylD n=1 Tax=Aliidongia dinghuensis TaxID=1867774 RepID=A0A8J3E3T9_9PROT|nr:efflux RND transporter periplasmic adaptor subunit [Aliidongia dinghuensis]GGF21551.1 secretion protein HylD [Aliidongia dinghuensis]
MLAVAAVFGLAGCKPADEDARVGAPLVRVAAVKPASAADRSFTGTVSARVQSDLGFRVSGKVVERVVDTGQTVRSGQVLMKIDRTDLAHAIAAQAGAVAAARARQIQTAADEARYRELAKTGAASIQAYDLAKAAADSARAMLSAAEAQAKVAEDEGDYSELRADADGVVVATLAEPGQVVTAGQAVVLLAHAGPREARVDLPEGVRPALGSEVWASLYGGADGHAAARLRQLSDAADARTRTFEARYVLEGDAANAPLGSTVTIHLPVPSAHDSAEVPLGAIDDEGKGPGVWVFDAKVSTVSFHPVKIARLGGESVTLAGGVRVGDQVIAIGGHLLHEGQQVRLADNQSAAR